MPKYTNVSVSGYNSNPPTDDGSTATANKVKWSTIKAKLSDPLNTFSGSIDAAVDAAFDKVFLSTAATQSTTFSVASTDDGKSYSCTNSITANLPAAGDVYQGFTIAIYNNGTGTITVDGSGSETINGSATLTLGAGEWIILQCDGSNWLGLKYGQRYTTEASVASATTANLGAASSNIVLITGTTTITSFGSSASTAVPLYFIRFSGSLTLTHNGTSLIIPGSANISTANGDSAVLLYLGSGNWKVLSYSKVNGTPVSMGTLLNTYIKLKARTTITPTTSTNTIPSDDTIPQRSEGDEAWNSGSLTPVSATERFIIRGAVNMGIVAGGNFAAALFRSDQNDALFARGFVVGTGGSATHQQFVFEVDDLPGSTTPLTYSIRIGKTEGSGGTVSWGDSDTARFGSAANGGNINIYSYEP